MRHPNSFAYCLLMVGCASQAEIGGNGEDAQEFESGLPSSWEGEIDPDVLAIMRHQETMQPAISAIYEQQMRSPISGFAGMAFEDEGVSLYYKGELSQAMLAALSEARTHGSVNVKPALFSLAELEADGAKIEAAARAHGASDIQTIGFNYDGSGLEIERMPADAVAALASARARAGKGAVWSAEQVIGELELSAPVHVTVATETINPHATRTSDTPPWNGGGRWQTYHDTNHDGIGDVLVGSCTTGFGVVASGRTWILTAAHCASLGDIAYHSGTRMGPINSDQWQYDMLLIDTAGWYLIFDGSPTTSYTKRVNSWGYFATNELVCQSGSTSGTICGLKTGSSTNVTIACCDSDGDYGYTIYGLIKTTQINGLTASRPGDSGGPVFTLDGTGVRAKGTLFGGSGTTMYFQDWADAIRLFGAYPRTN